jgi:pilus assembly protein CpaB
MAKRPGAGGIILVAVVLGLIAAYLIWSYLQNEAKKSTKNWQPVVIAAVDIKPRTKITRDMIRLERYPKDLIAESSKTKIEEVENRMTQRQISAKEQIRSGDIVAEGQAPTLAFKIPDGMRAIAIGAGETMAAGNAVNAGDHVDVLATYHDPRTRQELTKMILQNVEVLWVNKGQTDANGKEGANSSMTLAVTPEQGELLAAADRAGALRIQLRPVSDGTIIPSSGVTTRDFGGGRVIEEAVPSSSDQKTPVSIVLQGSAPRTRNEITVYRGNSESTSAP